MNEGMNVHGPGCDDYETPPWLFKALDSEFGLEFDAAATADNSVCGPEHYAGKDDTPEAWSGRVFCNPPYSNIGLFVNRALAHPYLSILLLPVRTDSYWFRSLQESGRCEFRFFRKRIRFYLGGKPTDSPRFASMIVIVRPK